VVLPSFTVWNVGDAEEVQANGKITRIWSFRSTDQRH